MKNDPVTKNEAYVWGAWLGQKIERCETYTVEGRDYTKIVLEDGRGAIFSHPVAYTQS